MKKIFVAGQILAHLLAQMSPLGAGQAQAYRAPEVLPGNTGSCGPAIRAERLAAALQAGFGVQYWGDGYTAAALSAQPHGLLIIEAAKTGAPFSDTGREVFFNPAEIALIGRAGTRPVLAYLNVGKTEDYRDYWITRTGPDLPEWVVPVAGQGADLAAYWTDAWHEIVMRRVDRLMALGVDGLFLDDVLQYYSFATTAALDSPDAGGHVPGTPKGFATQMMHLVQAIAARARAWNCDAFIVVNNGVFIGRDAGQNHAIGGSTFDRYLADIDAILVESALSPGAHTDTLAALQQDFRANDVPVLSLEFATAHPFDEFDELVARARRLGFTPYIAGDDAFNHLYPASVTSPMGRAFP